MKRITPICQHLKSNGTQCQSPAMRSSRYCYFHHRLRKRRTNLGRESVRPYRLTDGASIQIAISAIFNQLASGEIQPDRATALLYAIQLASSSARHHPHIRTNWPAPETCVPSRAAVPSLAPAHSSGPEMDHVLTLARKLARDLGVEDEFKPLLSRKGESARRASFDVTDRII